MAYNLHKGTTTKANLVDLTETPTNDSTNPNNNNNNNNDDEIDDEIAPVVVDTIIKEENKRKESNNNNKNKGKRKVKDISECESDDSDNMKNIEQQPGVDFFSGDIIFHQLLQATNFFFELDLQSVLSLTLTSKTLLKPLSSLISQHFTFYPKPTPLVHYRPKKLKIETFYIDGLLDNNPCLSSVTEIEFTTKKIPYYSNIITDYPFDEAITNLLSLSNLTHLTFESYFNQPINSLIHLTKLTHLKFNHQSGFNHTIDKVLPPNLTHLSLSRNFDKLVNHLPPNLVHLKFADNFDQSLHQLPHNLVYLTLGGGFKQPLNLLHLTKLTHLEFPNNSIFNHSVNNLLPLSLTKLALGKDFKHSINHLPPNITHITMNDNFNKPINLLYLTQLTHLEFSKSSRFNQSINHVLPLSLTKLVLGMSFDRSIKHLPGNLTQLSLGGHFTHSIDQLPVNITHLIMQNYTPLQYEQIQKMRSLLYFNNKPVIPYNSRSKKKKLT